MRGATAPRIGTARGNTITPTPIVRPVTQLLSLRMSLGVRLGDAALGGRVGMGTAWAFVTLDTRPSPLGVGFPFDAVFRPCSRGCDLRRWRRDQMALFDELLY